MEYREFDEQFPDNILTGEEGRAEDDLPKETRADNVRSDIFTP